MALAKLPHVKMRHPKGNLTASVPASSVKHHRRAGWQLDTEPAAAADESPVKAASKPAVADKK